MKVHWKILIWLVAGALVGSLFQLMLEATPTSNIVVQNQDGGGVVVSKVTSGGVKLTPGQIIVGLVLDRGTPDEKKISINSTETYGATILQAANGDVVWHQLFGGGIQPVTLSIDSSSPRVKWIRPFSFAADMFLRLLKMLIVPIILTSIISGVVGVGSGRDLRRLGTKTFIYYISTSLLAIVTGLVLINAVQPGTDAKLGLSYDDRFSDVAETSFFDVFLRMIPSNIFESFGDNINMLQVIFFALLFGYSILHVKSDYQQNMKQFFEAAFEVMMKLAGFVLSLIPYGVFCLLVKVIGLTGFEVFKPLGIYMITVVAALFIHSVVTLPLLLKFFGKISPIRWFKAMSPALITAYSTSSSSMTLPVTMEVVEKRGKVSNRIVSFVQPLGATINMDGTALYECVGVIFLAQYYSSITPDVALTFGSQILVVFMALMASIGAAGIPSAGLIMMVTILSALNLPVEGAALLLAVDRPLDMLRTMTNVWSDTCGAAIIARSEGEDGPLHAGGDESPVAPDTA